MCLSDPAIHKTAPCAIFADTEVVDVKGVFAEHLACKTAAELDVMKTAAKATALTMNKDMRKSILENFGETKVQRHACAQIGREGQGTGRQTDREKNQTDRQTDRQPDRETDRKTDRQKDRQTDREPH